MRVTSDDPRPTLLRLAATAVLLALAAAAPIACGSPEPTAPRPDLLLLVVRGQGTAMGCYGDADVHTPRMDDVAARGTLMERAYAATAGQGDPVAAILGGGRSATLSSGGARWSEAFADAGYRTGIVGHVEEDAFADAGLDLAATSLDEPPIWCLRQLDRFISEDDGRPWCLVVVLDVLDVQTRATGEGSARDRWTDSLELSDRAAGTVLDLLVDRGAADRLMGLFTTDAGQPLDPGAPVLAESRVRVPMIAFGKAVTPGHHAGFVSHADALPTLLELAGAGAGGIEGRSFARALQGEDLGTEGAPWRDQTVTTLGAAGMELEGQALRFQRWKYVQQGDREALFDLDEDPLEENDLRDDPEFDRVLDEARSRLESGPR